MPGYDTDWPADSTEFCSHPSALDIFVCGTYKLEQSQTNAIASEAQEENVRGEDDGSTQTRQQQTRRGKCLLFRVQDDDQLNLLHETELPAILDMKWCHRTPSALPLLGIADSEGHITLHELNNDKSQLKQIQSVECAASDILCLSLDWSNRRTPTEDYGNLIVSMSNGSLALLRPNKDTGLAVTDTWHAHDYEPWIAAWDYWNSSIVYSGGDDLKMKAWDSLIFDLNALPDRFDAGVTTIQSHPFVEHIIAVGSYDSTVRLFDTRKPLVPLTQVDVGGGAWRLKWHPSPTRKNDLLVACMHDGFKVVRFNSGEGDKFAPADNPWKIMQRFDKHTSLALRLPPASALVTFAVNTFVKGTDHPNSPSR
ncbi:WD-40 repeat-containing protein [Fomes fomentarius]|nr:WD-40 repeat-containing protein [Fomes fomentarius]